MGEFPENITETKQYGNNLKAFAAALPTVGMVSIDRIHELLTGVFDITVSTGFIQSWIKQLSSDTKEAAEKSRERISHLRVLNCDETGLRVNGSLQMAFSHSSTLLPYFLIDFQKQRSPWSTEIVPPVDPLCQG